MTFMERPDPEVRKAIVRLADALCSWERSTGRESVLIIRKQADLLTGPQMESLIFPMM